MTFNVRAEILDAAHQNILVSMEMVTAPQEITGLVRVTSYVEKTTVDMGHSLTQEMIAVTTQKVSRGLLGLKH